VDAPGVVADLRAAYRVALGQPLAGDGDPRGLGMERGRERQEQREYWETTHHNKPSKRDGVAKTRAAQAKPDVGSHARASSTVFQTFRERAEQLRSRPNLIVSVAVTIRNDFAALRRGRISGKDGAAGVGSEGARPVHRVA